VRLSAKEVIMGTAAVRREERALCGGAAFVWIATGLSVLHPHYRQIGHEYLGRLGLPDILMFVTCAAEVLLGLRVALGPPTTAVTAVQVVLVAGFTAILALSDPALLVHPDGVLTKNLPLLATISTAWLLRREGWSPRAEWLLRCGMAVIWITEGLFPKILFQAAWEVTLVRGSGLVWGDPAVFLRLMGACEVLSGVAALLLCGRPLRWLLGAQLVALLILPVLVAWQEPHLLVHPFGPLTKNVPILVGTAVLWHRARPRLDRGTAVL
jgi:hypothetical protein